jgi:acyl-CoA thioesterase-1
MKSTLTPKHTVSLFLCLVLLATMLLACGGPATSQTTTPHPTATPSRTTQQTPAPLMLNAPVVYVALGASDAVGMGTSEPDTQGYVPRIASHLPSGSQLVNLGATGTLLHDALQTEMPQAITTMPQLITIWLVTNDFVAHVSYDDYMQDLQTLLQRLRNQTRASTVMANLPDLTLLPALSQFSQQEKAQVYTELQRWNRQIAMLARQYNITLVDLFAQEDQLTGHPEYISDDGFHPSATGYARLADLFWKAIHPSDAQN